MLKSSMNSNAEYDYLFKILLIGNSGVGKSCMLMRYADNEFTANFYNTIGVDFKIKSIFINGKAIRLQIWDTAGQDRFRTITCSYYRGAHGILIVYDITDRESFENVKTWMQEIDKFQQQICLLSKGNKTDLLERRKVTFDEGQQLANIYGIPFLEVSAKNGINIEQSFTQLGEIILKNSPLIKQIQQPFNQTKSLANESKKTTTESQQSGSCC